MERNYSARFSMLSIDCVTFNFQQHGVHSVCVMCVQVSFQACGVLLLQEHADRHRPICPHEYAPFGVWLPSAPHFLWEKCAFRPLNANHTPYTCRSMLCFASDEVRILEQSIAIPSRVDQQVRSSSQVDDNTGFRQVAPFLVLRLTRFRRG